MTTYWPGNVVLWAFCLFIVVVLEMGHDFVVVFGIYGKNLG
jgi:hypothetical protein